MSMPARPITNKVVPAVSAAVASALIAGLGVLVVGCGGAHLGKLKEAASADLNCPKSRVHVLRGGKTRDIEACGQLATYRWDDDDWRMVARGGGPTVAPAQPASVSGSPTGTPSQPPPSSPAPGSKQL